MTHTEKILEEFRDTFLKDESSLGLHYLMTTGAIKKFELEKIESFLATSIQQALAEDRERVGAKIDRMIADELSAKPADEVEKTAEWYKVSGLQELKRDILSSLDKPLTLNKDI